MFKGNCDNRTNLKKIYYSNPVTGYNILEVLISISFRRPYTQRKLQLPLNMNAHNVISKHETVTKYKIWI